MVKHLVLIAAVAALAGCSTSLERPGDSIHVVQGLRIVAFCQKNPAHPGCVHHVAAAAKLAEYRVADKADYRDSIKGPAAQPGVFRHDPNARIEQEINTHRWLVKP